MTEPQHHKSEVDTASLLQEANEFADELRASLVVTLVPADVSPVAKVPLKARVFRELLLHRLSDVSDAACKLYNGGSILPAFVLTRAAFESSAVLFYFNKILDTAIQTGKPEEIDAIAMKSLFGSKDKATEYEAVNILTAVSHLEKKYPGLEEMFLTMCEFAHPNYFGVMGAYQRIESINLGDPYQPMYFGAGVSRLSPDYGLICLRIAISLGAALAKELAEKDGPLVKLCEAEAPGAPPPQAEGLDPK
jgi:hypothetical protein